MEEKRTHSGRLVITGLAGVWLIAILTTILTTILMVGTVLTLGLFSVLMVAPIVIVAITQGRMPWQLQRPTRNEWYLFGSLVLIAGFTVLAWALLPAWAWVAVPMAGLWGALSLYGLSYVEPGGASGRRRLRIQSQRQAVHGTEPQNSIVKEWAVMLKDVDIFKDLTEDQRERVAELGDVRTIREGESLGSEGQEGQYVYVILDGRAQLSANSSVGRITARVAGAGESLPLASILGDGRLITSIEARTDMRVWQVDSSKLRSFFGNNPEIAARVYYVAATVLAERYRSTLWRLSEQSASIVKSEAFWANV